VPDRFVVPWRVSLTPLCEEPSITRAALGPRLALDTRAGPVEFNG
jgi:hypothetical protein